MTPILTGLAIEGGKALIGQEFGKQTAKWQDERQLAMQEKLQMMQEAGNKRMADYGQKLSLDMWEKTNYAAQREQMKKAGLNVGLMYNGQGQGGTTQSGHAGQVTGGQAPVGGGEIGMGMHAMSQIGLNMAMQQAQIDNIKADTAKKQADTTLTEGAQTGYLEGQTALMKQLTTNAEVQNGILKFEKDIKDLEAGMATATFNDQIARVKEANRLLMETYENARRQNQIGEATYNDLVKQTQLATTMLDTQISAVKAGISLTKANTEQSKKQLEVMGTQIQNMITSRRQEWEKLEQSAVKLEIEKRLTEIAQQNADFNTSTPQQINQWVGMMTNAITLGLTSKAPGKIGF